MYCCKNTSNALAYGIKNNSNAIMNFPLKLCGCCDGCEPVARALELARDAGMSRASEDGAVCPLAGLTESEYRDQSPSRRAPDGRTLPGFAQGYAGHGRANGRVCPELVEMANGRVCSEFVEGTNGFPGSVGFAGSIASWSQDKKYLALVTETSEGCEDICVYAREKETDGLRLVQHVLVDDNARVCSVAWGEEGDYLAVALTHNDHDNQDNAYVYEFDKATEKLRMLPGIDDLLRSL